MTAPLCPLCKSPGESTAYGEIGCHRCYISTHPDTWALLSAFEPGTVVRAEDCVPAPPVPPDAEALVDAYREACMGSTRDPEYKSARAALLARLTAAQVTAEALWNLLDVPANKDPRLAWDSVQIFKEDLAAALAALRGK